MSSSDDSPDNKMQEIDLNTCKSVWNHFLFKDRPFALLVMALSQDKTVSRALKDIKNTHYYQACYSHLSDPPLRDHLLVKAIVYAKHLLKERTWTQSDSKTPF